MAKFCHAIGDRSTSLESLLTAASFHRDLTVDGIESVFLAPGLAEDLDAVTTLGEAVDESDDARGAG